MKEIVVISGKGGTGKTTFATSLFAALPDSVLADCDVDAPDTHILLQPVETARENFLGTRKAVINPKLCRNTRGCNGERPCLSSCRFFALKDNREVPAVMASRCEGCGVCAMVCPVDAISMENAVVGSLAQGQTEWGPMVYARLKPGEETSGKLVSAVRRQGKEIAGENGAKTLVIDGSPGIGCPVISSLTGAALAVLVTEPSLSAFRDLERLGRLLKQFRIPALLVINKWDISPELSRRIEEYCEGIGIPLGMKLPFDIRMVQAVVNGEIPSLALPELYNENGFDQFLHML